MVDWRAKQEPAAILSDGRFADLPDSVQELAQIIGRDRALALVANLPKTTDHRGGERPMLYVPKRVTSDHPLVRALNIGGPQDNPAALVAAQKLVEAFGGEILYPAGCKRALTACRDNNVGEEMARGKKPGPTASAMGLTARQVRNLFARYRGTSP